MLPRRIVRSRLCSTVLLPRTTRNPTMFTASALVKIHHLMNSSCDEYPPAELGRQGVGQNRLMHPLDVDPVSAARRLLGASLWCRGVEAKIVEVEAYGARPTDHGPIRRRTPSAAAVGATP